MARNTDPEATSKIPGMGQVMAALAKDLEAGTFGSLDDVEDSRQADIEYIKAVQAVKSHMNRHPDADPNEVYQKLMAPVKRTWIKSTLDWIPFVNPFDVDVEGVAERRQAITALSKANLPLTDRNIEFAIKEGKK